MTPEDLTELEARLRDGFGEPGSKTGLASGSAAEPGRIAEPERGGMAILVTDRLTQRLLEAAARQLDLLPSVLVADDLRPETLLEFEAVVAEEGVARELRATVEVHRGQGERLGPALIVVRHKAAEAERSVRGLDGRSVASGYVAAPPDSFDGMLNLPLSPAAVAEQLSLILYAHRAFARRFQSALEELHLNRRIFRSVTSGISVANALMPDLPLIYVNPAFEVMTGYRLEEVYGRNCRFLQGEDSDQAPVELLRQAIADRREVLTVIKNYRKDGTSFWNELSLSPIRNRQGEVTHFVGIQTDVTARVEFEAALRESEKLAAVGRLASSIAHEINNPLESVMNLLYLAQRTEDKPELRSYLSLAERELKRASVITAQSLRFYKQSTRPQAITCAELLRSVLDLYEGRAENASVGIERRERSTLLIVCLESEIRQVLNNLVRNAIDAMHMGKPDHPHAYAGKPQAGRLLLRTRDATYWPTGQRGVMITVADTGSGISAETMSMIYKAFFTTKGIAGTGLGLWITSEIVARHQGSLKVRSRVADASGRGHGTVFELFLPMQGVTGIV